MKMERPRDFDHEDDELLEALGLDACRGAGRACPALEELQAAAVEALPPERHEQVLAHAGRCTACGIVIQATREWEGPEITSEESRRIRARVDSGIADARRASRGWRRVLWVAPLAAAAAAVLVVVQAPRPTAVVPPSAVANHSPADPRLPLDPLAIHRVPQPVWRGAEEDGFDAALQHALAPYVDRDLDEAVRRLTPLVSQYPDAASVRLYLGVALLLRGDAAEAVARLEEARTRAGVFWTAHVQWYLAVAYERDGRPAEAAPLLHRLCGGADERYRVRACAGLDALSRSAPGRPRPRRNAAP